MRTPIPNPDVPLLDPAGLVSKAWYDFFLGLDAMRVQDLYDIASGATPADTNTIRYSASGKNWTFGA